jgi:hypothetical protein
MLNKIILRAGLLAVLTAGFALAQGPVFELRTYTAEPGKLEALKARFRDHTIAIFKRHHMESIGYWVPTEGDASKNTLIYILKHPSRAEADKNWDAFRADPEWVKVSAESEKNGKLVTKVDRVWMDATAFSMLK